MGFSSHKRVRGHNNFKSEDLLLKLKVWDMHIPEGLFENWYNHTSEILSDEGFEPTTQYDIRQCIGTIY